jgi:putative restriction endonuclease
LPLSPIDRIRLDKAAVDEGFGIRLDDVGDWLAYDSLGTPASLRLTRTADGFYVAAVDHSGVTADLSTRWPGWPGGAPPGFTAFAVSGTGPLHELVGAMWRLARSLPTAPLRRFQDRTAGLPHATEAERLTIQRVGQDLFRGALMAYWAGACAVTGLSDPRLLRASHIRPWAACDTDAERLDAHNGLLLAVHLDAAFDAGLIGFDVHGGILISSHFAIRDREVLGIHEGLTLRRVAAPHRPRLAWHRKHVFAVAN